MALTTAKLYRELVKACLEFHSRRLWERTDEHDVFALEIEGEEHRWVGSVMGHAGRELGLALHGGEGAFESLTGSLASDGEGLADTQYIGFCMDPLRNIPASLRRPLELARVQGRRETLAPFLLAKDAGPRPSRSLRRREAEVLLYALRAISATDEEERFEPTSDWWEGGALFTLRISGDARDPDIEIENVPIEGVHRGGASARRAASSELTGGMTETVDFGDEDDVPEPGDLDGWKKAELRLTRRLWLAVEQEELARGRSISRYFVDSSLASVLDDDPAGHNRGCFYEWLLTDYRPTRRSKTLGERWLATTALPEAESRLVEARLASPPGFHRVVSIDTDAGALEMEDVATGERSTVHDRSLAVTAETDLAFPGRVYPAGEFPFLQPLGPAMTALDTGPLLAEMERRDIGLLSDPPSAGPVGWLHALIEGHRHPAQELRRIRNTDGDWIVLHEAWFTVADREAVHAALVARPDVDYLDEDDLYVWLGEHGPGGPHASVPVGPGDEEPKVHLGKLEWDGDELNSNVNSAERFHRLKRWLTDIPGVSFARVEARALATALADHEASEQASREPGAKRSAAKGRGSRSAARPKKGRSRPSSETPGRSSRAASAPPEPPPEVAAALERHMHERTMRWLDERIPALGGRTPREAAKTEEGRRKMAMLIRMMPAPMPQMDSEALRRDLFAELGM